MTGIGVTEVNIFLGSINSGPDNAADNVIVNGTDGKDHIVVSESDGLVSVSGLAAQVNVTSSDLNDRLTVNALGGDDTVRATGLTPALILLTEDGGDGNDVLIRCEGDDVLIGGPGKDVLIGQHGNATLIQD